MGPIRGPISSAVLALAAVVWVAWSMPLHAQQNQKREAVAAPAPPPSDTQNSTEYFVGSEVGYDSNLDQRIRLKEPSRYEMVQAGVSGAYKASDIASYSLYLRGRQFWYNDLELSNRYDIDAAMGARYDFTPETSLKLGASWLRDAVPINRYDSFRAYADLVNEGDLYRLRLKLESRTDMSLLDHEQLGPIDFDVYNAIRSRAFDYSRNGGTASLLLFRKSLFAPFVIGNYSNIDYFNQSPNPIIDRRANETWGVAGVRVSSGPAFYVDLGARYNRREFADPFVDSFTSASFDASFTWNINDLWSINGVLERTNREPSTAFGYMDDVTTYELSTRYRLEKWTLFARAFLDRVRPVGDPLNYYRYFWSIGFIYDMSRNTEIYADYLGRYTVDHVFEEGYNRHRVGAGVRVKF